MIIYIIYKFINTLQIHHICSVSITIRFQCFIKNTSFQHPLRLQRTSKLMNTEFVRLMNEMRIIKQIQLFFIITPIIHSCFESNISYHYFSFWYQIQRICIFFISILVLIIDIIHSNNPFVSISQLCYRHIVL